MEWLYGLLQIDFSFQVQIDILLGKNGLVDFQGREIKNFWLNIEVSYIYIFQKMYICCSKGGDSKELG